MDKLGEAVDKVLRRSEDLSETRFIGFNTGRGGFRIPIELLKRLLAEEELEWEQKISQGGD